MNVLNSRKITISITDRANEVKNLELIIDSQINKKIFNKELIGKLGEFQKHANDMMTGLVEKEKNMLSEKIISNEHLKNLKKPTDQSEESSEDEINEQETINFLLKRSNDASCLSEPSEKKQCM